MLSSVQTEEAIHTWRACDNSETSPVRVTDAASSEASSARRISTSLGDDFVVVLEDVDWDIIQPGNAPAIRW